MQRHWLARSRCGLGLFMVRLRKNIIIGKPAQTIWAILDKPVQSSALNPALKLHYYYESRLGGYNRVFRYCMGGKTFETGAELTTYEQGRHMAYKTGGEFHSCWHWWLESDGQQTHVALTVEYSLPKALAGMDTAALEAEQSSVLDAVLANLKRAAEGAE
jgi:uncharacterized membrane protein